MGWRAVIYVSYRPKEEFTEKEIVNRSETVKQNRVTNHWSTHVFDKKPGGKYLYQNKRHPIIENMLINPTKVYEITGISPDLNDDQKNIAGIHLSPSPAIVDK